MPRLIIGYILQLLVSFLHAIILLNIGEEHRDEYKIDDNARMINWVLFILFFYSYVKSAQHFASDFNKLMNDLRIDEDESCIF